MSNDLTRTRAGLVNIANAIRSKEGSSAVIPFESMDDRIRALVTGGGFDSVVRLSITSSGTYTLPAGTKIIDYFAIGGGASGFKPSSGYGSGAGAGTGALRRLGITITSSTVLVTIGSGGLGSNSTMTSGAAGGDTRVQVNGASAYARGATLSWNMRDYNSPTTGYSPPSTSTVVWTNSPFRLGGRGLALMPSYNDRSLQDNIEIISGGGCLLQAENGYTCVNLLSGQPNTGGGGACSGNSIYIGNGGSGYVEIICYIKG